MIGDGVPKLVERSFAATGEVPGTDELAAHSRRFLEHYEPHAADLSTPFPGGVECLGRLKAAGYSDTKPAAPNIDEETGKAIPENQARNRRIVIRIH